MNRSYIIGPHLTLKECLKRLDQAASGILFVLDGDERLVGALSDGDARRAILAGADLDQTIESIFNRRPQTLLAYKLDRDAARRLFLELRIKVIPLLGHDGRFVDVLTWDAFFSQDEAPPAPAPQPKIDVPVVVMAGGKGTRLAPFTNVLPKPLIPIGEKTILELIIDGFHKYGVSDFYLTVNYRGEMIRAYMDGLNRDYQVHYAWEKDFCGTAGSLTLIKDCMQGDFIVSNCDIIVNANYAEVLKFHREHKAMLTMVSAIQHHAIPYGVIDFKPGGVVSAIREKPEYSVNINTGVYVLSSECLKLIPEGEFFHMTHLIEALLASGQKVVTYPVNESDYTDIGQWSEYHMAIDRMQRN